MDKEVETVVIGFVSLNSKQQSECLSAMVDTRPGDRVERSIGDRAANEPPTDDDYYSASAGRNRIF